MHDDFMMMVTNDITSLIEMVKMLMKILRKKEKRKLKCSDGQHILQCLSRGVSAYI